MFIAALRPVWLDESHLENCKITEAYGNAINAKEDYEYRIMGTSMTAKLWNRYVEAMCHLQELVKIYNRIRKC